LPVDAAQSQPSDYPWMQRRTSAARGTVGASSFGALAAAALGIVLLAGCPDRADVAVGGQSGDEGTNENGPPMDVGEDDPPSANIGPVELPYCSRHEVDGPEGPSRHYACFSDDRRYREGEARWSYGEPTPAGPYRCECNQEQRLVADAADCESALENACNVDLDGPLPCSFEYGVCWPLRDDPGGWHCRCSEGAPLVELRADSCDLAAFTACNTGACTDDSGRCTPRTDGVGHDCECASGEHVVWPGVWDCRAALSTCSPTCTSGSGGCALRDGGHSCQCAAATSASEPTGRVAPPDPNGPGAPGGSDAGSGNDTADADAGAPEWTFVPNADTYGLCRQALELTCGPPPAGESCQEEDEHGIARCTSDGAGAWDCDCLGRATHVTHQCPLPDGLIAGTGSPGGGLPPFSDPELVPDDVERRLYTCMDAVFNCSCE